MKKIIPVCVLLIAFCILLTACTEDNALKSRPPVVAQTEQTPARQSEAKAEPAETQISPSDDKAKPEETQAEPEKSAGKDAPGVVAESSNAVSDKEKQKILNDLSSQLDDTLNSIEGMEDVDDSDLNINGF
jgi:hypothetical protein